MSGMRNQGVSVSRVQQEGKGQPWRQAVSRNIASIPSSRAGRSVTSATGSSSVSVSGFCLRAGNEMSFTVRSTVDASGMPAVIPRLPAWRTPARRRGPCRRRGCTVTTPGPSPRSCSRQLQGRSCDAAGATGIRAQSRSISDTARIWMLDHGLRCRRPCKRTLADQ